MHAYNFPARKKYNRCITKEQASELMSEFCCSPFINWTRRKYLSTKLGLKETEIGNWFSTQRYTVRRLEAQVNWKGKIMYSDFTVPLHFCQFVLSFCSLSLSYFPSPFLSNDGIGHVIPGNY